MYIESMVPSSHLILCRPLVLPPSIFPSIRVFSNKLVLLIWCQTTGVFVSASVLPMNIQDWFPLELTSLISLQCFPKGVTHCPLVALWEIAGALQGSIRLSAKEATISCHLHSLPMRVNPILQVSMFGGAILRKSLSWLWHNTSLSKCRISESDGWVPEFSPGSTTENREEVATFGTCRERVGTCWVGSLAYTPALCV